MANSEKYCLRWNDFETNISTAFRELRDEKDFFDVTLACDDNQVSAHKVILSACSPFFRQILRRNPHQHPLLYLRGVKYSELVNVLNFMYQGEVNVAQEELNDFLTVAEDLRVKGLTQGNKQNGQKAAKSEPRTQTAKETHLDTGPPPKRKRPSSSPVPQLPVTSGGSSSRVEPESYPRDVVGEEDDDIQEVVPVKTELITPSIVADPIQTGTGQEMVVEGQYDEEGYDDYQYGEGEQGGYDEGQMMDQSMGDGTVEGNKDVEALIEECLDVSSEKKFLRCRSCAKTYTTSHRSNLRSHIEANHMEGLQYSCPRCYKVFKTTQGMVNHGRANQCQSAGYYDVKSMHKRGGIYR